MYKLLIVDDTIEFLNVLKIFLEAKSYLVETRDNTDDIFSVINKFKPDLLILDVILATEDGREICRQVKSYPENKELGILLTSASPEKLKDYKSCLADDYIEKPFDLYELEQKIQSMLTWLPIRSKARNA